jgi:hypothetical protein
VATRYCWVEFSHDAGLLASFFRYTYAPVVCGSAGFGGVFGPPPPWPPP